MALGIVYINFRKFWCKKALKS